MSEFPRNPGRRELHRQQQVSAVIKGMQDVCLEVGFVPVEEPAQGEFPFDDPGFNWQTFQTYLRIDTDVTGTY